VPLIRSRRLICNAEVFQTSALINTKADCDNSSTAKIYTIAGKRLKNREDYVSLEKKTAIPTGVNE
jgi:hypothetical protein